MKSLLVFILTLLSYSMLAQEISKEAANIHKSEDEKTKISSQKKWYLYLHGSAGNTSLIPFNGTVISAKLGVEYRLMPYLGIGFGISGNNSKFKEKTDSAALIQILLLSGYNLSSSINPSSLLPIIIQVTPRTFSLNYNTANIDFNFHMNKDRPFDPYIGFGLIGGSCTGGSGCSLLGGEARLGLQRNYETFFFYLQGQYQSLIFFPVQSPIALVNTIGSVGFGARF